MNNYKQDISDFIDDMTKKYGGLPKFAHNLKEFDGRVLYSGFVWDKHEVQAMLESVLFGSWSINGNSVVEFERAFSKKINQLYSLMVNSGSSANLVMIAGLKRRFNWTDDDEIITSCCAFPTTVSVIPQNRLKAVFVDINFDDLNIDLDLIEGKITDKTKAILFAPTLGNPGNFGRLIDICKRNNLHLILDGCDALGTTYMGNPLQEYAIASSCSLFASHHISVIQGGVISTNDLKLIDIYRSLSTWSRDCFCIGAQNLLPNGMCKKRFSNWLETQPDVIIDHKYFFTERGFNLQPLEFQGAVGLEQIKKLEHIHSTRKGNELIIRGLLSKCVSGASFIKVYPDVDPSWFGVGIICKDYEQKRKLVQHLEDNKIQTRNFFSGNILEHPGYKDLGNYLDFPRSSETLRRVFFIGCSPTYTNLHINYIDEVLKLWTN